MLHMIICLIKRNPNISVYEMSGGTDEDKRSASELFNDRDHDDLSDREATCRCKWITRRHEQLETKEHPHVSIYVMR